MFVSIVWLILAYLVGSFPFGLLIGQVFCRRDPRKFGSKNIGATNVCRVCGLKYGLLVLLLDVLKGFLPVYLATFFSDSVCFLSLTALACLLGHMYSVFLYGQGGKGVATTLGIGLALFPKPILLGVLVLIGALWWTGYMSVGSILFVGSLPFWLLLFDWKYVLLGIIIAILVVYKHKSNIYRLILGEEKSWRKSN